MPLQGVEILNLKKKNLNHVFWCTALFISSLHKYNFLNPKVFHSLHFKHQNQDILKNILIILLAFPFPLHGVEPDVKAMLRCTTLAIT